MRAPGDRHDRPRTGRALLRIGRRTSEYLSVTPRWRSHPDETDYWDGNWIVSRVEVRVGGFRGSVDASLRAPEFVSFRAELNRLYDDLAGEVTLETMEPWIEICIRGDGRGHFRARCRVTDEPGIGNTLEFELVFDQTDILGMAADLDRVIKAWPVQGGEGDA